MVILVFNAVSGQQGTIAVELLINDESLDKTKQALAAHQSVSASYLPIACIPNVCLQKIKQTKGEKDGRCD